MASMSTTRQNACFHEDDIDNDMLIDEIESRPLIYDKSLKDYSNSNLKAKAWEEVCVKVFFNIWGNLSTEEKTEAAQVVQKRWKNIRACFSRELRQQKSINYSQAFKRRKTYRYYEKLLFLLPSMETRDVAGNSVSYVDKDNKDKLEEEDEAPNKNKLERDKKSERKKSYKNRPIDILEQSSVNNIKLVAALEQTNEPDSIDSEKCFALSLVPLLKAVPEKDKINVQIKLLQVFRDAQNQ